MRFKYMYVFKNYFILFLHFQSLAINIEHFYLKNSFANVRDLDNFFNLKY